MAKEHDFIVDNETYTFYHPKVSRLFGKCKARASLTIVYNFLRMYKVNKNKITKFKKWRFKYFKEKLDIESHTVSRTMMEEICCEYVHLGIKTNHLIYVFKSGKSVEFKVNRSLEKLLEHLWGQGLLVTSDEYKSLYFVEAGKKIYLIDYIKSNEYRSLNPKGFNHDIHVYNDEKEWNNREELED